MPRHPIGWLLVASLLLMTEATASQRVNPHTDDLDFLGGSIGDAVVSGTAGSVLFIDASGNLGQDNASLYFDDATNRLGIGTTSPSTTLHVVGAQTLTSTLTLSDNQWLGLGASAGQIEFDDQTTDEVNILNANVGIGTSVPANRLDVAGASGVSMMIQLTSGSANAAARNWGIGLDNNAFGNLEFMVSATQGGAVSQTPKVVINSTGYVGIGTTAPGSILDLATTANLGLNNINVSDTATQRPIYATSRARGSIGSPTTVVDDDNLSTLIHFAYIDGAYRAVASVEAAVDNPVGAGDWPSRLTFHTTNDGAGARTEKMRIDNAGNVGIGTTAPARKLDVEFSDSTIPADYNSWSGIEIHNTDTTLGAGGALHFRSDVSGTAQAGIVGRGTAANTSVLEFYVELAGVGRPVVLSLASADVIVNEDGRDTNFRVESDTNPNMLNIDASADAVGIGTSAPAEELHVKSLASAHNGIITDTTTDDFAAGLYYYEAGTAKSGIIHYGDPTNGVEGGLQFLTGGITASTDTQMVIDATGLVGIGTSAPATTLDVVGGIASRNTAVTIAAAATTFAITSNVVTVTGDALGNVVATITGGVSGQLLTLIFVDALVTITDDATGNANTVNLSAGFVSTANDTLTLVSNGTSWREVSRAVN